jgi:hypothetical protein
MRGERGKGRDEMGWEGSGYLTPARSPSCVVARRPSLALFLSPGPRLFCVSG